jgi:flavin reductase (DIM6/NTAB) family NADH-FMN oxidoreductase RutF
VLAVDVDTFKRALGGWVSGVTIVTSRAGDRHCGMTASAFCAVSADPPQVLVCANRGSSTRGVIQEASAFGVSILARGQRGLSELFADKNRQDIRFEGLECPLGVTGCPRIPGALVHLDCSVTQVFESGTHSIYIGLVEAAAIQDREPLAYHRGEYWRLRP